MMSSESFQHQIDDLYSQEDDQEPVLYHQDGEDEACTDAPSILPCSNSNGNVFGSASGTPANRHDQWCSSAMQAQAQTQTLAKPSPPRMKRRLPFSSSATTAAATAVPSRPSDEVKAKKQMAIEQEDHEFLRGFTKISLPSNFTGAPFYSPERRVPFSNSNTPTPSPVKITNSPSGLLPPSLPPLPPLSRTISDPTPASSICNSEELLKSEPMKSLKTMRNQLKEISAWWDHVLSEQEREHQASFEQTKNSTEDDESGGGSGQEESVSVEVVGKCLSVNFGCPCGKGYQILLSGRNCYYKLI